MPQPTRELCHINLAREFRGGERQTELLIRALASKIPRQRLVARQGAPLARCLSDLKSVSITTVANRLAAVAATRGSCLIHAHETHGAQVALLRKWLSKTPYVITRREVHVPSTSPYTRSVYRQADCVVAVSKAIEDVLMRFDPTLRCAKIPDACSDLPFNADWVGSYRKAHTGKVLVGNVAASVFSHKGQDVLLRAAERLEDKRPNIEFILVGSGRDERQLRSMASSMSNVTVAGWASNVGDFLAVFDLFVLPSRHEGLGSILLDAMEFGLPVVASNVGGIPEVVEDGRNGLLVPAGDPDELARAIDRLCSDEPLRRAMSESNRARAREFTAARMAARYLKVYAATESAHRLGLCGEGSR